MTDWAELRRRVVWEDSDCLVLDKPPGVSVMGERHGTDVVRLAGEAGEPLHWVNRIDKVTSGAVLLAKSVEAQGALTRQFARRSVAKTYLAVVAPSGLPAAGCIDLPLMTAGSGRVRVAAQRADIVAEVVTHAADGADARSASTWRRWSVPDGKLIGDASSRYPSLTTLARVWQDDRHAVLLARPVTGRRHQIRVHLAWAGHAIAGDPLFDRTAASRGVRTCLHSWRLGFDPVSGTGPVEVVAPPGADLWEPVAARLPRGDGASILTAAEEAHPALARHQETAAGSHRT